MKNPDVEIAAICDVYEPNLTRAVDLAGGKAKRYWWEQQAPKPDGTTV